MSLWRAMGFLPDDRATEATIRSVLQLMRLRRGESLSAGEIARRVDKPEGDVSAIVKGLAEGGVLLQNGEGYSYVGESSLDVEVDLFVRRSDRHEVLVQSNVAKFRDRYRR